MTVLLKVCAVNSVHVGLCILNSTILQV